MASVKISFSKASFIQSVFTPADFPAEHLKEIAIVGRSNVGKSSLINHLLATKRLARVSSTPGKTQSLNYYLIDDRLFLVDLPGYGYAKAPKQDQLRWVQTIEHYLEHRKNLSLILFLIDIRRDLSPEDLAFLQWSHHFQKPILAIFTKSDKVSKNEMKKYSANLLKLMEKFLLKDSLCFSIKDPQARKLLIEKINRWV